MLFQLKWLHTEHTAEKIVEIKSKLIHFLFKIILNSNILIRDTIPVSYTNSGTSTVYLKEIQVNLWMLSTVATLTKMCCATLPVLESRESVRISIGIRITLLINLSLRRISHFSLMSPLIYSTSSLLPWRSSWRLFQAYIF